jgi:hypothetical protein
VSACLSILTLPTLLFLAPSSAATLFNCSPTNTFSQQRSAIRKDQLTRLTALIRKRTEIEMAITEKTARLNRAYEKASADLRRSTKQRAGRIEEAVAAAGADSGDQEEEEQSREDKENEAPPVPVVKLAVAPTRTRGAARVWGSRRFVDGTR